MASTTLTLDTASVTASFTVKKLGFLTVKGVISGFSGAATFAEGDQNGSAFDLCGSVNTINTGSGKRDEHLRGSDFFDVERFPSICFRSNTIVESAGQYKVMGDLTILEVTKSVEIPFQYQNGKLSGQFSIKRLDYGLGTKFPAFFVGNSVQISIICNAK